MAKTDPGAIASAMGVDSTDKAPKISLHLTEDNFKDIEMLHLGDKVELIVEGKVTQLSNGQYDGGKTNATIEVDDIETQGTEADEESNGNDSED